MSFNNRTVPNKRIDLGLEEKIRQDFLSQSHYHLKEEAQAENEWKVFDHFMCFLGTVTVVGNANAALSAAKAKFARPGLMVEKKHRRNL